MSETRSPGQYCYEAYANAHGDPAWFSPWHKLVRDRQQPWEAAAQAVLAWREAGVDDTGFAPPGTLTLDLDPDVQHGDASARGRDR